MITEVERRLYEGAVPSWEKSKDVFFRAYGAITNLSEGLNEQVLTKRILIQPAAGLQEAASDWSLAMILDHLNEIGRHAERYVIDLRQERTPFPIVDTTAIQPSENVSPTKAVEGFVEFYQSSWFRIEASVGSWESKSSVSHPWFGPLSALDWAWFISNHGLLHLHQIEQIVASQKAPAPARDRQRGFEI